MNKIKLLASVLLAMTVLFAQFSTAAAAPLAQDPSPITGTIQSITLETDAEGTATVLVTLMDDVGGMQTVRLSVETALALGLVTLDPVTGSPIVDETQMGQTVEIDPATVIPDATEDDEAAHPISELLAAYFGEDASVVDGYHEDGFGFGVIAQAMWMSQHLNGNPFLTGEILEAKETGDYSAFILPDGSTPSNWGQFKKAVLEKKNNLGVIVSGHADPLTEEEGDAVLLQNNNGNGNGHGNGKNKDKGKGKNK